MQLALKRTHHPSDTFMVRNMQLLYFAKDCKLFHHSQNVLLRRHCYIHFLSYCILTEKKTCDERKWHQGSKRMQKQSLMEMVQFSQTLSFKPLIP